MANSFLNRPIDNVYAKLFALNLIECVLPVGRLAGVDVGVDDRRV